MEQSMTQGNPGIKLKPSRTRHTALTITHPNAAGIYQEPLYA
jgi:hypothetical protein